MSKKVHRISAMKLRRCPGTILDKCYHLNEVFIVQRATKTKAVIISYKEFHEFQLLRQFKQRLSRQRT